MKKCKECGRVTDYWFSIIQTCHYLECAYNRMRFLCKLGRVSEVDNDGTDWIGHDDWRLESVNCNREIEYIDRHAAIISRSVTTLRFIASDGTMGTVSYVIH